ncbi:hypothetical protein AALD74_17815 [Lachnospiraceae bacterium 48-21]
MQRHHENVVAGKEFLRMRDLLFFALGTTLGGVCGVDVCVAD